MATIALIVAAGENGVIGKDGGMPWHLPADLKHFKATTMGKPIVMGRHTFEAIGRALPGRRSIVVTRRSAIGAEGIETAASLDAALALAGDAPQIMVIGGGELYRAALSQAQRIFLTRVHAKIEGDTFFPDLPANEWREITREERNSDDENVYALSFILLERCEDAM
ncbi:MAG: dihydrofolate reductase [Gammaproteobacteria bacterium]|nr:dihydrofolate reductase [Gammaproteobacteria bacterium]